MSSPAQLTPSILANELLFSRTAFPGSFLVLEGPDDRRFWERRIDRSRCKCTLAHAKTTLLMAFEKLDGLGFKGAVGVVDADLDHVHARPAISPNVLPTDTVDLEALLLRSPALEAVLLEFGDPRKIETFEQRAGRDIRSALVDRALLFGRIRWVSERLTLRIPMEDLSPYKYVDEKSWSLDEHRLLHDAARLAPSPGHTTAHRSRADELRAEVDSLPAHDPWHVVRGKDMVRILDIGLKRTLGAKSHADHITRLLRQGIDSSELFRTSVGEQISAWEHRNRPFVVLARPAE